MAQDGDGVVGVDSEWNFEDDNYHSRTSDPEGKMVSDLISYHYGPSASGDADADRWVSVNDLTIYPGDAEWGSGWYVEKAKQHHNWYMYGGSDQNIKQVGPDEHTSSVDTNVSIGYGAAYVTFDYTVPDISFEHEKWSSDQFKGKWTWNDNHYEAEDLVAGSVIASDDFISSDDVITQTYNWAKFNKQWDYPTEVDFTQATFME